MSKAQDPLSRRGVIATLGLSGGAVATWVLGRPAATAPAPVASIEPVADAPKRGGGYTASEHVRRYYKTTRV